MISCLGRTNGHIRKADLAPNFHYSRRESDQIKWPDKAKCGQINPESGQIMWPDNGVKEEACGPGGRGAYYQTRRLFDNNNPVVIMKG